MSLLLLSTDLMATSKVSAAAKLAGVVMTSISPAKAMADSDLSSTDMIAIDLTAPISDISGLVEALREKNPSAKIIAFGPHVHEAKLEAATQAGCDQVMPRGAFHKQIDAILASLAGN